MRAIELMSADQNNTVECRYNAVQYNMIFLTALCLLEQNINQRIVLASHLCTRVLHGQLS